MGTKKGQKRKTARKAYKGLTSRFLGSFTTNRNQLFIAWNQKQFNRAIRLGWKRRR